MREGYFDGVGGASVSADAMTLEGTVKKIGILFALVVGGAVLGWAVPNMAIMIATWIAAVILSLIITFKPTTAPILAPFHALSIGYGAGVISLVTTEMLKGTKMENLGVPVAVAGTLVTFGVMLFLYARKILRLNETWKSVIMGATAAVMVTYLFLGIASFAFPKWVGGMAIFGNGPIGIGFSIVVIGLAAFNYLMDFDMIDRGIENRAPKHMEWYGAFALVFTTVWLYLEILRLISKLNRR
jgi:uncharacterized YccA/Bax inhibitor family protein